MNELLTYEPELFEDEGPAEETTLRLWRGADGRLMAGTEGPGAAVRVQRCFPWSEPLEFVSLRDADDEEVALVRRLSDLPEGSRKVLSEALVEAGFVFEVQALLEVEEEIEIRTFEVRTRQGIRRFQTHRDEWPRDVPGGGLLIKDVVGDLYWVREPEGLDKRSRKLLWPFLD
ncbi:MAG: DUF1854 domain-containing protein [Myxococcota bacterium]|nr:DUF1854 domain-containing protein [Myxococcota bacterium]